MKDIQQLIKKNSQEGRYEDIFPKTFIDAVLDKESGVTLTDILAMFNMLFLSYNGSRSQTRLQVPSSLRRKGLWVTYVLYDKTVVTEWYSAEAIDDTTFGDNANWRDGSNALVGDISISSDGYWVINGEVTNIKAQGEAGITPILRVGSNNHLQVSYTNDSTYVDVSPNPVFTQFRVSNNKLEQSVDLGLTWTVASNYIAAWFRFTGTTGSSQADNVGKIQISRDNGATWSDLSGEFTNSLHIKGYVATVDALPSTAVQGDIYGVGPTYDPSDTEHTNPIYQLYVKDSTEWVNNGRFTSIAAGVVQELGDSETKVVSQKGVSDAIKLENNNVILNTFGDSVTLTEPDPHLDRDYMYSFLQSDRFTFKMTPNDGNVDIYLLLHNTDGSVTSHAISTNTEKEFYSSKNVQYFTIRYGSSMTATSATISIKKFANGINYAPNYYRFNEYTKGTLFPVVNIINRNKVHIENISNTANTFGFLIDLENNSTFRVGDVIFAGIKDSSIESESASKLKLLVRYYNAQNSIIRDDGAFIYGDFTYVSGIIPGNTSYIKIGVQSTGLVNCDLGEFILSTGTIEPSIKRYFNAPINEEMLTQINYAPYYPNWIKAVYPTDFDIISISNNTAHVKASAGAKVFGFQVKLSDTEFSVEDMLTLRLDDVTLISGDAFVTIIYYNQEGTAIVRFDKNLSTSSSITVQGVIPENTYYIVCRIQSRTACEVEVGKSYLLNNFIDANTKWIREELLDNASSKAGQDSLPIVFVNYLTGSDSNTGESTQPLKTINAALSKFSKNAVIFMEGDCYERCDLSINPNLQSVKLIGKSGSLNRIIIGTKIDSASVVQSEVYSYAIDSFPSNDTSYCIWQHEIPQYPISNSEKHPLQRGKMNRLDSTKLTRVDSLETVKSNSEPCFYYDISSKVLYFRIVNGSSLALNPIYLPTAISAIGGNNSNIQLEVTNIESWYSHFDLYNCNNSIITECSAKFGVDGGFKWGDCNNINFIRCEACGIHDFDNIYGDGFSVGTTKSNPTTNRCTTFIMTDCWSHDNYDDGYSDHLNNEGTIDGGLFEYNDGGITTSYGSKDVIRNVYSRNNTDGGIIIFGSSSEGTEALVQNCICENNSPNNFVVENGQNRTTKGTFINCISMNAQSIGYAMKGTGVSMTLIDCKDVGSPTVRSPQAVVIIPVNVS